MRPEGFVLTLLRVAHLVPALVKGGGERAAVDLANWQALQGHDVSIIAGRFVDEALLRSSVNSGVEVKYISRRGGRIRRYLEGPIWLFKMRRWLSGFDVIHAHLSFSAAMLTLVGIWRSLTGSTRPVLVETYHAVGMPISDYAKTIHGWMAKRRDAFVLMAEDSYWREFRSCRPDLRIPIIPNGLNPSPPLARSDARVRDYARRANIDSVGQMIVGNIGRLVAERRPDLLAGALCSIGRHGPDSIQFLIVGEGPERDVLARAFSDAGLSGRVHLPGSAIEPVVPISLMDLYISLNVGPITGLAGLEAAQCGVPVIAIQLDAQYSTGAGDWIWSDHSPEKVAVEALRLLADAEARRKLGNQQKEYAKSHFSIESMGLAYEALYADLLADPRGPR